jgi:adenine deaminase
MTINRRELERRLAVARGDEPADLLLAGGKVADVFRGVLLDASVAVVGDRIAGVGDYQDAARVVDVSGLILAPALIECHMHVESTLLPPAELARVISRDGTGTVIADPHEVANVAGVEGVEWMRGELEGLDVDIRLQASPCVPATPLATTGSQISASDVERLVRAPHGLGLAELMNFPGAVAGDRVLLDKLAAADGRPIDGHCPGLTGRDLQAYASLGVSSDHEATTATEGREKLSAGLYLMVRYGSTADDLDALLPVVLEVAGRRCVVVNDDVTAEDLLRRGHLTDHLRRVVAGGLDPFAALRMATLNGAELYGLSDRGALAPGRLADLVGFTDVEEFGVRLVVHHGRVLDRDAGAPTVPSRPLPAPLRLPDQIDLTAAWAQARGLPAIGYLDGKLLTVRDDSPADDAALLLAVDRYNGARWAAALVTGFGIARGALATTVAHDHHNLMVIGRDDDAIAHAIELARSGAGMYAVEGRRRLAHLPLDLAGLMSSCPAEAVAQDHAALRAAAHSLGCTSRDPLMALSFLGLEVIPSLKLTDVGLVDVDRGELVASS